MKVQITKLENELLNKIMSCEVDGIGMGYSEYDGEGISNEEKGVLSSLIQKELVYDSHSCSRGERSYIPMYCTSIEDIDLQVKN